MALWILFSAHRSITTLCNYCVGEAAALEASSGLIRLAPNHHSRAFLATQVVDEARHLEVFLRRIEELGIKSPRDRGAHPSERWAGRSSAVDSWPLSTVEIGTLQSSR